MKVRTRARMKHIKLERNLMPVKMKQKTKKNQQRRKRIEVRERPIWKENMRG